MQFSVIYSVDVPKGISLKDFAPPQVRRWSLTEGNEQFEYGYLEGRWTRGKHRKWTALLTRKQFDAFVAKVGLYAERTETMGSLGAPGLGFGWSPAISFTGDHEDAILNASIKQYHRLIRDYIARESLADIGVVHMVGCLTPLIHGR